MVVSNDFAYGHEEQDMRLLSMKEASEMLLISTSRGYEMARQGILPHGVVVRLGRQLRVNEERLQEWLDNGGQALPGGWRRGPTATQ